MTAFTTTFIDARGRRRRDIFEARDETAVRTLLRARSLWPVRVEPVRQGRGLAQLKIPNRDLVALLHQLELLLRAGVTADEALRQLAEDAPPGAVRTVLDHVHGEVAQGQPIHASCRFFERIFPAHVASVIAAGEISARLPEALRGLAAHLTRIEDLRRTAPPRHDLSAGRLDRDGWARRLPAGWGRTALRGNLHLATSVPSAPDRGTDSNE